MTTTQLHRLNRTIDILYRHSLGEPIAGIARLYSLTGPGVSRVIKKHKGNRRLMEAVEDRKAVLYAGIDKD